MDERVRVILIGGTSNVGKSTVAAAIGARLGWGVTSTDRLARYPGRPWAVAPEVVKPHVVEHYLTLDDAALVEGQLAHYRNMWPIIETLIRDHTAGGPEPLVLEGSGVWPERVAGLDLPAVAAVWLTGSPELIEARIHRESRYAEADATGRRLIDRFVVRSQGYDRAMMAAVRQLGLPFVEVTPTTTVEGLVGQCLASMLPFNGELGGRAVAGKTGID